MLVRKSLILAVLCVAVALGQTAEGLYQRTEYEAALRLLDGRKEKSSELLLLRGKCEFMRGEFKRASDALEEAARLAPNDSRIQHWLGRAYGRRAENSSFVTAPGLASRARERFERAVALDPNNREAIGDLFEYYMGAPGFLGGGTDKAAALAEKYKGADRAEYHYRLARLARKRDDLKTAEAELRRAMEAEPGDAGRIIDVAQLLARQRRYQESDALFDKAERIAPASVRVMFERARAYAQAGRNLEAARELLLRYLNSPLTPDDPPRSEAERLLKRVSAG